MTGWKPIICATRCGDNGMRIRGLQLLGGLSGIGIGRAPILEAGLILEHVAPNAVPVGAGYVGDAAVCLD